MVLEAGRTGCVCVRIYRYMTLTHISHVCIYTWNPNDPCFEWKGPSFGGFNPQNRGQTGSRYINVYTKYVFNIYYISYTIQTIYTIHKSCLKAVLFEQF